METPRTLIVVGGGTSGLLLTYQLLQTGGKVILICDENKLPSFQEVYPSKTFYENYLDLIPFSELWTVCKNDPKKTRILDTVGQKELAGRKIEILLGKGLGGSSNINAMIHYLGHRTIYDDLWPKSWNYDKLHSVEISLDQIIRPFLFSSSGMMNKIIDKGFEKIEISSAISGYPTCMNVYGNHRFDIKSILKQYLNTGNLQIIDQRVKEIVFDSMRNASKIILENNRSIELNKKDEVVLSSGALESPRILKKSILGFFRSTKDLSPDDQSVLSFIGENFQDHVILPHLLIGNWSSNYRKNYPLNSVHGWIYLDQFGNIIEDPSINKPRYR